MMNNIRTKVAFVIVCWNNEDLLEECLSSISDQSYEEYIVIMVDNGSKDNSIAAAKKTMSHIKIIDAGQNLGFAKGNNVGIKEAFKDPDVGYVVLLNTDAVISKDWTKDVVRFASKKPKAALMQGTTLDYYDHEIIDSTHIYVAKNGQGTQGHWRDYYESEIGPKKVFGVNAAACLMTRAFLEAQPLGEEIFDETMFMYLEDVDLSARATVMGWDNYLVPNARAYHMGSASSGKKPGFSLYMTFRNNSAMLIKNFPISILIRMLPRLIKGDIDTMRTLWHRNNKSAIWLVLRGRIVGIFRLPLYFKKTRVVKQHRKKSKDYLRLLMNKGY